jgi:hypothetical protein
MVLRLRQSGTETAAGIPRLPWRRIALWVGAALMGAWALGYTIGLLARYLSPA